MEEMKQSAILGISTARCLPFIHIPEHHLHLFTEIIHSFNLYPKMVNISKLASALVAASLFNSAIAHPGEHHEKRELDNHIKQRQAAAKAGKRSLSACESSAKRRGLETRNIARRAQAAKNLRHKRGIKTRKIPDSITTCYVLKS